MYSIDGLLPSGHPLGGYGFCIHLAPEFRDAVAKSGIKQSHVDHVVKTYGQEWLQKCGFSSYFDPENCTFRDDGTPSIPSKETRPLHSHREIRISWGEWGIEHISVPGNACGLDIDRDPRGSPFENGVTLYPHNVDSWSQVVLMLVAFTWFANSVFLFAGSGKPLEE